jgi:cyclopropane fatty-acyl-phospholipid synthase-like methyltransferase
MQADYKEQSKKVAAYYNQWQPGYNEVYGDTIQAFRPAETGELMEYLAASIAPAPGMKVLDAGCGVAGPAIWLAENCGVQVEGITISEVQLAQGKEAVAKKGLNHKVNIRLGDYHELDTQFDNGSFDLVLFLESLGHSGDIERAIAGAFNVLKQGGSIYIKDFYYKQPADAYWRNRVEKTIANINRLYSYNTLNLNDTLTALRSAGFEIDFVRKFSFKDNVSIRFEFEKKFGIDIFGGEPEFAPAEWLEIKCIKPGV